MSLTVEQKRAHERYQAADPVVRKVVDLAVNAARDQIIDSGMVAANDDRAEALVAAILIYIEDSAE
jgi:hypothetical protein